MSPDSKRTMQVADVLTTQLQAAQVYATFMRYAEGEEHELWNIMFDEELLHARCISEGIRKEAGRTLPIEDLKPEAFRDIVFGAVQAAGESSYQRLLWALRLEHAEIDFGLERAVQQILQRNRIWPGDSTMNDHYKRLLSWARRYDGAPDVAIQIARIEEHIPGF